MQGFAIDARGTIRPDVLANHAYIENTIPQARAELKKGN